MALTIHPSHAYALLAGLYVGKFTNFFSDIVITGLVLYIVTPQIFTEDRLERAKNWLWSWFNRNEQITIKMSELELTNEQKIKLQLIKQQKYIPVTTNNLFDLASLPKIEIIPSPKGNLIYNNGNVSQ